MQLNNLAIPGNYTFKVTVTDTDHVTNSTTANITVLKVTDYPPEANAGKIYIFKKCFLRRDYCTLVQKVGELQKYFFNIKNKVTRLFMNFSHLLYIVLSIIFFSLNNI